MKKKISCARNPEKVPQLTRLSRMLFCLLLLCQQLHAQDAGKQKVNLQADNQPLQSTFLLLEQQTGYTFAYNSREIKDKLEEKFSFKETNKSLSGILDVITKRTGLQFKQSGRIVSVQKGTAEVSPAQRNNPGKVSGKIIDENGQPVPGATIRIGNTGTTTGIDGSFSISLAKGSYTAIVSYIGYGTKEVTEIIVRDNQTFELNVVLKKAKGQLAGIVVRSQARKEGVAALYVRQKNTAEISNGISSEQISATPDKNVGEVLKRISGVSTNDNRRVVIRGIAERYNVAMLDGVTLPSTDVQVRDFEFDIIPSNLIDNIIVSKSYTPDMSFGFGGGLVQINTLAIPAKKFNNINFGGKYNDQSTGKEFLGYRRGKQDYLGFDDGGRKNHFPKDMFYYDLERYNPGKPYENVVPPGSDLTPITPEMIAEQNKRIGGTERLGTRIYKARPSQNYQLSLGRSYHLGKSSLGFVGSVSYRNEQIIDDISHFERGDWSKNGYNIYDAKTGKEKYETTSKQYNFTTTWAALINGGWQTDKHKIITRNFYSRGFQSRFVRTDGFTEWSDKYEWKYGFSEKYEEGYYETSADGKTKQRIGDTDTYIRKVGRSFSFSVSYSF